MAALLALGSSLLWGSGDFLGGRASRHWSVLTVLVWSQLAMFLLLWLVVLAGVLLGDLEVAARTVLLGAAGGVAGVVALAAFYRALALGPMSVVPPIAAAGVVVPVAVGLATGLDPTRLVLAGMALAVVGVLLASIGEGTNDDATVSTRIAPTTLLLCLVSASGFGLIFVAIDAAATGGTGSALVATTGVRTGSVAVLLVATIVLRARPWQGVSTRPAAGFLAIGLFDTGANLAFAVATTIGELAVVAVLGSLYPAVTSALAHVVLGERLGRVQLVGVALALTGVGVLALR
jgi:drug/metabolite transporter (DMT)-like permease